MPTRRCGLAPSTAAVAPTPRYSDAIGARWPGVEALLNMSGSSRLSLFIDPEGGFFTGRDASFRVRFRRRGARAAPARSAAAAVAGVGVQRLRERVVEIEL